MRKSHTDKQETMSRSVLFLDQAKTHILTYNVNSTHREKCTFTTIWREALLPYLSTRLVLLLVGLLSTFYILPLMANRPFLPDQPTFARFPQVLWMMWLRFDSGFYVDIAQKGYWGAETLHGMSNWAFYPLYAWLIACVRWLFGSGNDAYVIAGVVISLVASSIAMSYLYALIFREFGQRAAALTVLYLSLFPTSFYFSAVYPEALFLALALASLYYARQQSWLLACLCGGLAALTRAQGVLLVVPIAWEYLRATAENYVPMPELSASSLRALLKSIRIWPITRAQGLIKAAYELKNWFNALLLLLIPTGLFVFMLYARHQTGDLLATFHTQAWGWHRSYMSFIDLLIYSLRHPILNEPLDWNFWPLNIILAFLFLGSIVWAFFRLPTIYALYTLIMVLLPLSSSMLNSFDRYCILVFPTFLLLALFTQEKRPALRQLLTIGFPAIQAILMLFFVVGVHAIA